MCDAHPYCPLCDVDLLVNSNVLPGEPNFTLVMPRVQNEFPHAYNDSAAICNYMHWAKVTDAQYQELCLDADIDSEFGEDALPQKPKMPKVRRQRRNEDKYAGGWSSSDEDNIPDEYLMMR